MATIQKIKGFDRLVRKLQKLERGVDRKHTGNVVVGYSAAYAVYVHESLEAAHGTAYNAKHQGEEGFKSRGSDQQAKFLEQPSRVHRKEMMRIVREAVKNGVPLVKALLMAGMFLQRKSQQLVPVDTGNLKASAFTEKE